MDAEKPDPSSHTKHSSTSSSPRCTQCNAQPRENGRNLVVCIDGTSNEFGNHNTNVVKLFAKVDLKTTYPEQRAYYSSGIGTDMTSGTLARVSEMAAAWTIDKIIKETYSWLAQVYQEGDQIYLFGFSRGAYQVRVLASMIHEVGLIRTRTDMQVTRAYDYYKEAQRCDPDARYMARKFKSTFSWTDMRVHFVGVWDTVCSVGLLRPRNLLNGRSPAEHACHFRHALALDERRSKFRPEHLREVNSWTDDRETDSSLGKNKTVADIKEVWFAGSHSDVGGADRSGKSHAGNVSLLWMRREAEVSGLVLQPTDIVWVPDDIDLGVSDSMVGLWRIFDLLQRPRHILPGQKVHASILYANAYSPQAFLGYDPAMSVIHSGPDVELDNQVWETGLFDDTAALELIAHLDDPEAVAPAYLDRLLFMLRSPEGKHCIGNVLNRENRLLSLIQNSYREPFMRLGAAVACYEASCDSDTNPRTHAKLLEEIFDNDAMRNNLSAILKRDRSRVVALLRPLSKHRVLWERILTEDILKSSLLTLFDEAIFRPDDFFVQAMDGLTSLLRCEGTQIIIIEKLDTNPPHSNVTRLSLILEDKAPSLLTAALRMMMTLARIEGGRPVCSKAKTRLRQLAETDNRLVGLLSIEILLTLYNPGEQQQLNIHNANVRANLAEALVRLIPDRHGSGQEGRGQLVGQLFGVDDVELTDMQKMLIRELKNTVQHSSESVYTAAALTIPKLCESNTTRTFLREIGLLDILIQQLRYHSSALLAAHVLATCLKYDDMKEPIKESRFLPRNIVRMIEFDTFHDTVGGVEGFHIFSNLMQRADLREKIKNYNIAQVLETKLASGWRRGVQTSLICLDIFRSLDPNDPCASGLVAKSLYYLRNPDWKRQKAGVTILSALAQSESGVAAIDPEICKIIELLLPEHYIQPPAVQETSPVDVTLPHSEARAQPAAATAQHPSSTDAPSKPPSRMMGPIWALRILALNKKLRETMHNSSEYGTLKRLYLSGKLFNKSDTRWLYIYTPDRADVVRMLDNMIKAVDQEQEGLMSVGDAVCPDISHMDRLLKVALYTVVALLFAIIAVLVVSLLVSIGVLLCAPYFVPAIALSIAIVAVCIALAVASIPVSIPISVIVTIIIAVMDYWKAKKAPEAGTAESAQAGHESDPGGTTDVHAREGGDDDPDPHNSEHSSRGWLSTLVGRRKKTTDETSA